jgi:hypothetical protein
MCHIRAERAKAFTDRRSADWESACQRNISDAATAADSLMELHVEMRSADTDMDVNETTGRVWGQLIALEVRAPTRELWQQKLTASNAHFDRLRLTNAYGHECSVCDSLQLMRVLTNVIDKHVDVQR